MTQILRVSKLNPIASESIWVDSNEYGPTTPVTIFDVKCKFSTTMSEQIWQPPEIKGVPISYHKCRSRGELPGTPLMHFCYHFDPRRLRDLSTMRHLPGIGRGSEYQRRQSSGCWNDNNLMPFWYDFDTRQLPEMATLLYRRYSYWRFLLNWRYFIGDTELAILFAFFWIGVTFILSLSSELGLLLYWRFLLYWHYLWNGRICAPLCES